MAINLINKILFSQIRFSKTETKPPEPTPAKKHLVIQTVYGSSNPNLLNKPTLDITQNTKAAPIATSKDVLDKQRESLLRNNPGKYSAIDIVKLDSDVALVGLTRHSQTIMRGIFMYPDTVQETDDWIYIKSQATFMNTNIAVFRTLQPIDCLKLTTSDTQSTSYLIDHRAVSRTAWLWHSSTPSDELMALNESSQENKLSYGRN